VPRLHIGCLPRDNWPISRRDLIPGRRGKALRRSFGSGWRNFLLMTITPACSHQAIRQQAIGENGWWRRVGRQRKAGKEARRVRLLRLNETWRWLVRDADIKETIKSTRCRMPAAWCRPIGRYRRTGALLKVLVGQSIRSIRHTLAHLGNASTLAELATKLPLLMRRTSKRVAGLFILRMYGMRVRRRECSTRRSL